MKLDQEKRKPRETDLREKELRELKLCDGKLVLSVASGYVSLRTKNITLQMKFELTSVNHGLYIRES